jgi:hypothetical protein
MVSFLSAREFAEFFDGRDGQMQFFTFTIIDLLSCNQLIHSIVYVGLNLEKYLKLGYPNISESRGSLQKKVRRFSDTVTGRTLHAGRDPALHTLLLHLREVP